MTTNKGSNKSKTKAKKVSKVNPIAVPSAEDIAKMRDSNRMFAPGAMELDGGATQDLGLVGGIKEMLEEENLTLTMDGEELEEVSGGLLEPGPGEELLPGDMSSVNEKVVRKIIPERTLQKMDKLIQCLRQYGNPTRAAQAAGITRSLAYRWRSLYPGFAKVWTMAMNMAIDDLETEARRRAFEGVLKPAGWYKGKAGGKVREYSDLLLMFLLKAYRPDKFKDRIEASGAGVLGVKVQITDYSHATPETGPGAPQIPVSTPQIESKDQRSNEDAPDIPAEDDPDVDLDG